jgi:hypothetical protein
MQKRLIILQKQLLPAAVEGYLADSAQLPALDAISGDGTPL